MDIREISGLCQCGREDAVVETPSSFESELSVTEMGKSAMDILFSLAIVARHA